MTAMWSTLQMAEVVNPLKAADVSEERVDMIRVHNLCRGFDIAALRAELPTYQDAARTYKADKELLGWWSERRNLLPHWSMFARRIATMPTSSAAVERMFAYARALQKSQGSLSDLSLEEHITRRYNRDCLAASTTAATPAAAAAAATTMAMATATTSRPPARALAMAVSFRNLGNTCWIGACHSCIFSIDITFQEIVPLATATAMRTPLQRAIGDLFFAIQSRTSPVAMNPEHDVRVHMQT